MTHLIEEAIVYDGDEMLTDQYLVTIRVDISRNKDEQELSETKLMQIVAESIKGLEVEVIEASHIGLIDNDGDYIEG